MDRLTIYCADIGRVRTRTPEEEGAFAWARAASPVGSDEIEASTDIERLASQVSSDLERGSKVALGFECPLFIPVPQDSAWLGKARPFDKMSWSSPPGSHVLTIGLAEVAWVLSEVHRQAGSVPVFLDWREFAKSEGGLLLWEAMIISGKSRNPQAKEEDSHRRDARVGVVAFDMFASGERLASQSPEWPAGWSCYSLVGAALLRAGWDVIHCLAKACLVVKTTKGAVDRNRIALDMDTLIWEPE